LFNGNPCCGIYMGEEFVEKSKKQIPEKKKEA
jgi:hypothetical protein